MPRKRNWPPAAHGYQLLITCMRQVEASDDPGADLIDVGVLGFRGFAIGRPHLFRLTFERTPAEALAQQAAAEAGLASYQELLGWVARAQEAGTIDERPRRETAFAFHALCQGLAGSELAARRPPDGPGQSPDLHTDDMRVLWRNSLPALITGMRQSRPSRTSRRHS